MPRATPGSLGITVWRRSAEIAATSGRHVDATAAVTREMTAAMRWLHHLGRCVAPVAGQPSTALVGPDRVGRHSRSASSGNQAAASWINVQDLLYRGHDQRLRHGCKICRAEKQLVVAERPPTATNHRNCEGGFAASSHGERRSRRGGHGHRTCHLMEPPDLRRGAAPSQPVASPSSARGSAGPRCRPISSSTSCCGSHSPAFAIVREPTLQDRAVLRGCPQTIGHGIDVHAYGLRISA